MSFYRPHMLPKIRSKKITDAAEGKPCTLRISSLYPGYRCSGDDTTVACHPDTAGKGMATKSTDLSVAFGCLHCHDILDGRDAGKLKYITENYPAALAYRLLQALVETLTMLFVDGVIQVPGAKTIK